MWEIVWARPQLSAPADWCENDKTSPFYFLAERPENIIESVVLDNLGKSLVGGGVTWRVVHARDVMRVIGLCHVKHMACLRLVEVDLHSVVSRRRRRNASNFSLEDKLDLGGAHLDLLDVPPVVLLNLLRRLEDIAWDLKEEDPIGVDRKEACGTLNFLTLEKGNIIIVWPFLVGLDYLSSCVEEEPIVPQSHHLMAKTRFRALQ